MQWWKGSGIVTCRKPSGRWRQYFRCSCKVGNLLLWNAPCSALAVHYYVKQEHNADTSPRSKRDRVIPTISGWPKYPGPHFSHLSITIKFKSPQTRFIQVLPLKTDFSDKTKVKVDRIKPLPSVVRPAIANLVRENNQNFEYPVFSVLWNSFFYEKLPSLLEEASCRKARHRIQQSFEKQISTGEMIAHWIFKQVNWSWFQGWQGGKDYLLSSSGQGQGLQSSSPPRVASPKYLLKSVINPFTFTLS